MLRNTLSLKVDRYRFRTCLYGNFPATVGCGNRVVVRIEADRTETIYPTGRTLARVEGISGKRMQLLFLHGKHRSNGSLFTTDLVRKIFPALLPEHPVQILHGFRLGNRDADVAANIAYQTFYKALFVSGSRIAEHGFKAVVSSQSGIAGLFPGMGTEAILDGDLAVAKDDPFGTPPKY